MSKCRVAFAAGLSAIWLASCGIQEQEPTDNRVAAVGVNVVENVGVSDSEQPGTSVDGSAERIPPPDAVSHPDGYLPLGPGEPEPTTVNSSDTNASPPATEDEYIRNKQEAR